MGETSCNEWRSNLLEGRGRFVQAAVIRCKITLLEPLLPG